MNYCTSFTAKNIYTITFLFLLVFNSGLLAHWEVVCCNINNRLLNQEDRCSVSLLCPKKMRQVATHKSTLLYLSHFIAHPSFALLRCYCLASPSNAAPPLSAAPAGNWDLFYLYAF